jgi:hypothetical protein
MTCNMSMTNIRSLDHLETIWDYVKKLKNTFFSKKKNTKTGLYKKFENENFSKDSFKLFL